MSPTPLAHAEVERAVASAQLGIGASDLHGSLAGFLAAGGQAGPRDWLGAIELDHGEAELPRDAIFEQLYRQTRAQLDDPDLAFEPLLPDDGTPIERRTDALVEWSRGFLGGLGLAGASGQRKLTNEAAEFVRDLGNIAGTSFEFGDAEEDESAYAEVIEFIRIGVLLLHAELTPPPARPGATLH